MAPTRPHRRTLHLLVPSPFPTSAPPPAPSAPAATTATGSNPTPSSPTSPYSPPPQTKKPSRKVLALAREMAAERGEILLDPSPRAGGGGGTGGGGLVGAQSEAKSVKGAREWNDLLCWARKKRGPQWDAATQMWQVDFLSPEYYEPSLSVPAPPVDETPLVPPPTGRSTTSTDPIAAPEGILSQPEKMSSHTGGGTSGLLDAQASSSSRSSRRRG